MDINTYLKKHAMNPLEFAMMIKCSIDAVYRWKRGKKPSKVYKKIIEDATNGEIKIKDW